MLIQFSFDNYKCFKNYLQSHGNNLASFLLLLKNNFEDSYKKIVDYVRDVVPQFQDFYLEPVGNNISLRWKDNSATDYVFNSYQLSDRSIWFIALVVLLLQPAETMPSAIIINDKMGKVTTGIRRNTEGIFRLFESIREEMSLDPSDASNVYMFMSRNPKAVKNATGYNGRTWLILREAL